MTDLLEKLKEISIQTNESDAPFIIAAIDLIKELEAKLATHEDDTTDWHAAVEAQMGDRKNNK
jgi:hypothetical protein